METQSIRQKLHEYVDTSDEKLIKLMFALAKEYNDDNSEYEFSEEDIKAFDDRQTRRLSGMSKTYSWEEAKLMITGKANT